MRTVSRATTQVDGNAIYVATASEEPVSLFITEAGDTAMAISLTLAPRHIPPREVRLVLTGGVDRNMGAVTFVKFCKIGALSPDGSRPFDQSANGFGFLIHFDRHVSHPAAVGRFRCCLADYCASFRTGTGNIT